MWRVGTSREGLPSEQGTDHKFRDFLQWCGLQRLCNVHPRNDVCADHSVTILVLVFLKTNPVLKRTQYVCSFSKRAVC